MHIIDKVQTQNSLALELVNDMKLTLLLPGMTSQGECTKKILIAAKSPPNLADVMQMSK